MCNMHTHQQYIYSNERVVLIFINTICQHVLVALSQLRHYFYNVYVGKHCNSTKIYKEGQKNSEEKINIFKFYNIAKVKKGNENSYVTHSIVIIYYYF